MDQITKPIVKCFTNLHQNIAATVHCTMKNWRFQLSNI